MPVDTTVPVGESVQLRCEPSQVGESRSEVRWYMDGEPIERYLDGERKKLVGNVSFIHISNKLMSELAFA